MRTLAVIVAMLASHAAEAAPAWCKAADPSSPYWPAFDAKELAATDPEKVVVALMAATCAPNDEATAHAAEIEKNRQAWGKRLGMSDADWGDVVAYASLMPYDRAKLDYSTKQLAQFTPLDQWLAITDGFVLPDGNGMFKDPSYVADVFGDGLSEVGRYAYIEQCLREKGGVTSTAPPAAYWALCQADVEKLDVAKLYAELHADAAHNGSIKMVLRLSSLTIKQRLAEHATAVQAAWKRDPVYKKMFEVAAAGRAEWEASLAKQFKLLELVQQMDSAAWSQSRSQSAGCEAKTADALAGAVGKVPASTFKAMKDQRFDPFGGFVKAAAPVLLAVPEVNLAAIGYVLCQPKSGTAAFLLGGMPETLTFRGPRTTALTRLLASSFEPDGKNEQLQWPATRRMYAGGGGGSSAGGVVDSVKVDGNALVVKLEKMIVKTNDCVKSHTTRQIYRIYPDGRVQYQEVCDEWAMRTHDQQWADFRIKKAYEPLLKKGVKFSAVHSDGDADDVVVVWPSKTSNVPSWLVGAKLR